MVFIEYIYRVYLGKFNLSHIWDRVLLNTNGPSLK